MNNLKFPLKVFSECQETRGQWNTSSITCNMNASSFTVGQKNDHGRVANILWNISNDCSSQTTGTTDWK